MKQLPVATGARDAGEEDATAAAAFVASSYVSSQAAWSGTARREVGSPWMPGWVQL